MERLDSLSISLEQELSLLNLNSCLFKIAKQPRQQTSLLDDRRPREQLVSTLEGSVGVWRNSWTARIRQCSVNGVERLNNILRSIFGGKFLFELLNGLLEFGVASFSLFRLPVKLLCPFF